MTRTTGGVGLSTFHEGACGDSCQGARGVSWSTLENGSRAGQSAHEEKRVGPLLWGRIDYTTSSALIVSRPTLCVQVLI